MKKVSALALAGLIVLAAFCLFPRAADARDVAVCYSNHASCRSGAMDTNFGWVRTALLLTVCDVALGRCLLLA